jgi:hypothetical protein
MDRVWKFLVHLKPTCCSLMQREASPSSFNVAPIGTAQQIFSRLLPWQGETQAKGRHAMSPFAKVSFTATELTQLVLVARTCTDTSHPCTKCTEVTLTHDPKCQRISAGGVEGEACYTWILWTPPVCCGSRETVPSQSLT